MSAHTPTPDPAAPRPAAGTPARPAAADKRRVVVLTALGLVLVVLAALLLLLPDGDDDAAPAAAPTPTATPEAPADPDQGTQEVSPEELQAQRDALFAELVRRDEADPTAVGAVDAPVVMVMWADYRCGFCAKWAVETAPGLADLVADGTLRIEWRDFPVITEQSPAIAVAARAAGLQGRFWDYHDRLFADHDTVADMNDDYLRAVATELGLDMTRFDADRTSEALVSEVQADIMEARAIGVSSTPSFLVNGTAIAGAQPLETFRSVIESERARAEG